MAPGTLFQQEVISLAQVLIKSWKWLQDPWGLPQREKGGEKGKAKKREKEFDDSHWKPEAGLYQGKDEEKNLITVILSGM